MSTLVSSPTPLPPWKQEVNRRLAEHKNRKGLSVVEQRELEDTDNSANGRAAELAARVAARYAKAPSYSEMQAAEARSALRVAEAATRVALEAQVAANTALANFQTAAEEAEERDSYLDASGTVATENSSWQTWQPGVNKSAHMAEAKPLDTGWEPDAPAISHAAEAQLRPSPAAARDDWRATTSVQNAVSVEHANGGYSVGEVEAAQPIHANLLAFPRQLVATHRMRPRLSESQLSSPTETQGQLSIFEVDPSSVSTQPAGAATDSNTPEAESLWSRPSWSEGEWSAIQVDAEPQQEAETRYETESSAATVLHQAPMHLRMMAATVDAAFILGMVCALAVLVASKFENLPNLKSAEVCGVAAVLVIGVLYQMFFLSVAKMTPGMRYAQISLCTFDDETPSPEQLRGRMGALLLSLIPMGLGLVWAIFDEDHMSWHDRFSRTYLREC